jgi:hypothetical protein
MDDVISMRRHINHIVVFFDETSMLFFWRRTLRTNVLTVSKIVENLSLHCAYLDQKNSLLFVHKTTIKLGGRFIQLL